MFRFVPGGRLTDIMGETPREQLKDTDIGTDGHDDRDCYNVLKPYIILSDSP